MTSIDFINRLIVGECRAVMRSLPEKCVQTVVTSPPYWGLRDYGLPPSPWSDGWSGCYGLEPTPEMFIAHSVEVFREVRRILRDDGTLWLNLGDSYNQDAKWGGSSGNKNEVKQGYARKRSRERESGTKPGDLCNMPHRVASALQADGWYWRSTIIWAKRSPMPESISGWRWVPCRVKAEPLPREHKGHERLQNGRDETGRNFAQSKFSPCPGCDKCRSTGGYILRRGKWRPTTAHEYVFLFSKSERYFCDGDAVQEMATYAGTTAGMSPKRAQAMGRKPSGNESTVCRVEVKETRNPRSVWTLSSEPYKGAHFATFPTMLAKKCIEAGTSAGGCCPECHAPYAPIVESQRVPTRPAIDNKIWKHQEATNGDGKRSATSPNLDPQRHIAVTRIVGYRSTCNCIDVETLNGEPEPVPCLVFDPFTGSGTTPQVAAALGLRWCGSELNPDYAQLAEARIATKPKWAIKKASRPRVRLSKQQRDLFGVEI